MISGEPHQQRRRRKTKAEWMKWREKQQEPPRSISTEPPNQTPTQLVSILFFFSVSDGKKWKEFTIEFRDPNAGSNQIKIMSNYILHTEKFRIVIAVAVGFLLFFSILIHYGFSWTLFASNQEDTYLILRRPKDGARRTRNRDFFWIGVNARKYQQKLKWFVHFSMRKT